MITAILAAMLIGPLPYGSPTLQMRIHVGAGRESAIIRSELTRDDAWFASRRFAVQSRYQIVLIDDLYKARPSYQIGSGDDRHEFAPGAFSASGSFIRTLESVAAIDQWDRESPDSSYYALGGHYFMGRDPATKPEVFPPQPTPPPTDNPVPDEIPVPTFEPPDVP